jgi:hypothetical protein
MVVRGQRVPTASLAEVQVVVKKLRSSKHIVELLAMDSGENFKSNEVG